MERPVFQPPGTPVMDLDTPALVVDLDVMDRNIETLHARFSQSGAKVRPNVTGHQTPKIAHRQLQAENTVGGISVTSVGEAEVFSDAGITDILIASQIVTPSKIRRLCALAGSNRIGVAVDNPQNVSDLSQAATAQGSRHYARGDGPAHGGASERARVPPRPTPRSSTTSPACKGHPSPGECRGGRPLCRGSTRGCPPRYTNV